MIPGSHRQWHTFYADPSDDVVFESRDKVFFRASKFRLAQTCDFFKTIDTLLLPSEDHFFTALDAQSLTIFLDLTTSRSIPPFGRTIHSPILLYDTFKSFGCEKGAKWLLGVIRRYIAENEDLGLPFLVDCMVERNLVLTKAVLGSLPVEGLIVPEMWDKLREVEVAWRWALMESVFGDFGAVQGGRGRVGEKEGEEGGDTRRRLVATRSPAVVAEMFNPSGPVVFPPKRWRLISSKRAKKQTSMATIGPPKVVSGIVDGKKRRKSVAHGETLTEDVDEDVAEGQ